jgi:hypothetical protein
VSGRLVHSSAVEVAVPAERAFEYLADGLKQSEWALGSWRREQVGDGLFRGTSLFTGELVYVRITATRPLLLVDYEVGPSPERLMRVNSARAIPGEVLGRGPETSVVTLTKWRLPGQDDEAWEHACATFDTEIRMIKGRLERGFRDPE